MQPRTALSLRVFGLSQYIRLHRRTTRTKKLLREFIIIILHLRLIKMNATRKHNNSFFPPGIRL